jgi:eukaryotic-like serine/threonine-protein kinase
VNQKSDEMTSKVGLEDGHLIDSMLPLPNPDEITVLLGPNELSEGGFEIRPSSTEFPKHLGRFSVRESIACGGMAIIVRAHDDVFRRDVACKLLLQQHASKARLVERFLLEAQLTANLQHPGIVPVYELGRLDDGRPYFAMKLIKGHTLLSLLRSPLTNTSQHLQIFEKVCQTLAYSHSKGVVHLDLKPSNVMVGSFGEVHLMDWGLAKICDMSVSMSFDFGSRYAGHEFQENGMSISDSSINSVDGTPSYMSPEQARGEAVDLRSDVFGLGAMLCEILTGEPTYVGKNPSKILLSAVAANLSDVHAKLERIGSDKPMVRLAKRCIAVDPDRRPQNAGVVAAEVTSYLESLLQEGMKDWHRFFEISLDLFCIASFEGYFLRVNGNFSRVLGYEESELISRPFIEFVHRDDCERTADAMIALLKGQPVERFRNRYRAASGKYLTLEWSAKAMIEEQTIFAVARDVTQGVSKRCLEL